MLKLEWLREVLVSLTVTNPMATQMLLKSLIAKKERALPEYVEILQRPLTRQNSTPDIADWLYYFAGSDRTALSANRAAYARLTQPVAILWGDADDVTPLAQARDLDDIVAEGATGAAARARSYSADRSPRPIQRRPAQGAWDALELARDSNEPEGSWTSSDCAPGAMPHCLAS